MVIKHKQCGVVLVVSLIMLVILTLLVVASVKLSTTNLKIVGNEQALRAMEAAAQQAIETTVQNINFSAPVVTTPVAVNAGTTNAASVVIAVPECQGSVSVPGNSIGIGTLAGGVQTTYWDVQANVTDGATGATVEIHQGIKTDLLVPCQ
jgi:Tfp pilus assembly protein PilX